MFCLDYYPHQKYLQDADEFKVIYRPADRTLQDFLKAYPDKSIVLDVSLAFSDTDARLIGGLYQKYPNFRIMFDFRHKEFLSRAKEYNIPYFFSNFATKIDEVHGLLKYHPTDMYICEELGFSLVKISKILHAKGVKVRVFPNICQSGFSEVTSSIKTFFIRPEDIAFYSNFVDVFELVSDKDRQSIIFKIYKQQKWFGKIQEIIPTFKGDLDNKYMIDNFATLRADCGKRCLYKPGSCNICDRFIEVADTLKEHKIVVNRQKAEN